MLQYHSIIEVLSVIQFAYDPPSKKIIVVISSVTAALTQYHLAWNYPTDGTPNFLTLVLNSEA